MLGDVRVAPLWISSFGCWYSMEITVYIEIPLQSEDVCRAVIKAVEPDNRDAPAGVSIQMMCSKSILRATVVCREVKVLTCRNTVDDLVEHVLIAARSVRSINHAFKSGHEA